MTLSKSLESYADIKPLLDTAVERGALRLTFENKAQLTRWRQRAYKYRSLLIAREGSSPYGLLSLREDPSDECALVMSNEPLPQIETLDGTLLDPDDFKPAIGTGQPRIIEELDF